MTVPGDEPHPVKIEKTLFGGDHRWVITEVRRREVPTELAGCVHLTLETVIDDDKAAAAFLAMLQAPQSERAESFELVERSELITDPRTMLPRRVLEEKRVSLEIAGKPRGEYIDRREWTFEWDVSAGSPATPK